ncbi:inositol monophosphatase family protein [Actinomycetota bacterium]
MDDAALAATLVQRAGSLAAQMRAGGLEGRRKTSVSDVVTAADHAAEAFVVDALRTLRPDDGIVGEEGADQESRSGRTWVIDPVDGTYNFLSGLTYWCSALALTDPEGVLLGAVHHPAPGETWLGGRDLPTELNGIPVEPIADLPLSELSLATYVHPTRMVQASVVDPFLSMTRGAATVRMLGSGSVDLASVAGGRLGAWVQMLCPDWDWLPGKALVEAAGGATQVLEHRGHRWHLAGGPTAVHDLVKALNLS